MASRSRNVDLGPMYLQVGEEAGPQGPPTANADDKDVARFESLMRRSGDGQRQGAASPESLLGSLLEPEPAQTAGASTDDLGSEIAHLWVGTGLHSAREVRVGLRDSLLPDTSVRLYECEGRLRIEFTCGTLRIADWLTRKLPALARELGRRLDREMDLDVFHGDGSLAGSGHWSGVP